MFPRTRVKICGVTRSRDALEAARLGVDALGFVFYESSPRRLTIERACSVAAAVTPFVAKVALFLDADTEYIKAVVERFKPDTLQFHGNEPEAVCASFGVPYIKAVPMGSEDSPQAYAAQYQGAQALLFDSHDLGAAGGSGDRFNWARIPSDTRMPIVLAGGLNPGNVAQAIRQSHPFAVDVSTGVESQPAIKDHALMAAFVQEVAHGDKA